MSLQELLNSEGVNKIEAKTKVVEVSSADGVHTFSSKYPLMTVIEGKPSTYGGDSVTHGLSAAWETVDPSWKPHSLHSHFLKPGRPDTPVFWEVSKVSTGRRYAMRSVKGIQNGVVFFMMQVSFSNSTGRTDVRFQTKPSFLFEKYKKQIQDRPYVAHTHDLVQNIFPTEVLFANKQPVLGTDGKEFSYDTTGNRTLGIFFKLNDSLEDSENELKAKVLSLSFLSDSTFLQSVVSALGLKYSDWGIVKSEHAYFSTSLDHSVYFHTTNFKTDDWLYMEFRYPRMVDDRLLCYCSIYNLDGELVSTVVQEALVSFSEPIRKIIEKVNEKQVTLEAPLDPKL